MARTISQFGLAGLVVVSVLASQTQAFAALNEVAGGVSVSQPLGNASQTLDRPLGFQATAWIDAPEWVSDRIDLRLSAAYQPYSVQNLDQSTLNFVGVFGGVQVTGGSVGFGLEPFFAVEAGGVYTSLNFSGLAGATTNAATHFAARVVPGLDFPVFGKLGAVIELPMTVVFQQSVLAIWSGSFSLRWKL